MPDYHIIITLTGTGTSSGVPMIGCDCAVCTSGDIKDKRLRSSLLIQSASTTVVIDTGPDFREQMLTYNVKNLDGILLTHSHKDHIAGLDDVRAYNFFQKKAMEVFGSPATLERIRREFDYAFTDNKLYGVPAINLHCLENIADPIKIGDLYFQPIPVMHLNMPVLGFRLNNFTYITDANFIDDASKELIKGSDILVINALRKEPHISHFTLDEAKSLADELRIPQVYFTHISHQMGLHELVNQSLPADRQLAYDGLQIVI